jgi:hypothetical protein
MFKYFFFQFAAVQYIIGSNKLMVQLTSGGRTGPTATEGVGKILTNIFETNYCRCYYKHNFFLFLGITIFPHNIQRYVGLWNTQTYNKLPGKKDW